ncbi:MAG TPA: GNAT family N-acetyltransferase [Actinomycetota bacterium]|nr:GNAT family N-acetyltransferase [Actinomycetota bacterium]
MSIYPAGREADVVLRDGSTVHVRPVRAEDKPALLAFLRGLSADSRYLRFFSGSVDLADAATRAVDVDYDRKLAVVAEAGGERHVVAHAIYLSTAPERAEVALAISDAYQGRGLGTILVGQLAEAANTHGIREFEARVLPENHRMIEVFRQSGFPVDVRYDLGEINVTFPTSISPEAIERFERREQTAAIAAMGSFLAPRSVAVIGASRSRGTIGGEVFHNLLVTGFNGPVYPVNPGADVVQSVPAYSTVGDVPGPVDLAVIVVPASLVVEAAHQCGEKGVRALVVISSGFAETGEEGRARQRELLAVCRGFGMRLIGPNCMGLMNVSSEVRLNATFAPAFPPHGRVGFSSQSGALGLAVIDYASSLGLGLSSFVSVGNKADISGNDLIHYWEADPETDVILLYLESFGNPRKFARITRRVGRTKPIVAVKSGRSSAGARATSSHTGSLIAASDVTVDALFRQAGVIRTDTLAEMFDVASLLANQPPPAGMRVGILTNAGGLGILCADACEADGLEIPTLPEETRRRLSEFLPAEASVANPVDMIASATAADYRQAIEVLATAGAVDALIVIFVPPLVTRAADVARALREAAGGLPDGLPLLSVFMSAQGVPPELRAEGVRIPSYAFPEEAARALAHAARYRAWRARPQGTVPEFTDVRSADATALLGAAVAEGPRWLRPDEVAELLSCYGLPFADWRLADSPEEAARAAEELAGAVALKAVAPGLVHKTEAGAVRLGLATPPQVEQAAREMMSAVGAVGHRVERFLVQRMVPAGVEMLIGAVHDPSFGPVVACGGGGTAVELVRDVSVRITPLTDRDATEMVRSLATFPLLEGYRGTPPADVPALEDAILRVGAMVEEHPEIAELDCNPVMVLPSGVTVVDARVRVEAPMPPLPLSARRREA